MPAVQDFTIIGESNGHHWFEWRSLKFTMICCRDCGIIRRADDKNKPCRGVVKVELRTPSTIMERQYECG